MGADDRSSQQCTKPTGKFFQITNYFILTLTKKVVTAKQATYKLLTGPLSSQRRQPCG